jgi:serine/threonine protein kinase
MSIESRRLGKYELRERLASGGQGEVWKAFDERLRRFVAIKQLNAHLQADPGSIARFEREAQFIAALHHPNIVQIHDFQFVRDKESNTSTAYMVMDYIEGSTLGDYIRATSRKKQFPPASDVVSIFTAVSLALDYAHQKGMVHRDIKPANIMLDKRQPKGKLMGEPILMDFGIAKLQGGAETTKVLGTPLYVSPEQALGLSGDKRSDLYSLGIILYEVMAGTLPFRSETIMAILLQHAEDNPPPA